MSVERSHKETFAAYIPAIHRGYINAFERHPEATIGVLDRSVSSLLDYTRKDIRALFPETVKNALEGMGWDAEILSIDALTSRLKSGEPNLTMPDDDLTREIERQFPQAVIEKEPIFLRWDRDNSQATEAIEAHREIGLDSDDPIIQLLSKEMGKSPSWWRRVSAALKNQDGLMSIAHNSPVGSEHKVWIEGDPRSTSKKGQDLERSLEIHAEARIISEAAKNGIKTEGSEIFVTTFPCPNCAKLIVESGIKTCYFIEGYAMLDSQDIFYENDVEIVRINTDFPKENPDSLKPYPTG